MRLTWPLIFSQFVVHLLFSLFPNRNVHGFSAYYNRNIKKMAQTMTLLNLVYWSKKGKYWIFLLCSTRVNSIPLFLFLLQLMRLSLAALLAAMCTDLRSDHLSVLWASVNIQGQPAWHLTWHEAKDEINVNNSLRGWYLVKAQTHPKSICLRRLYAGQSRKLLA